MPTVEPDALPSLWRNRDWVLLWFGQVVSNIGSQVSQLAFPLLVLALTRSPAAAGLVGAVRGIPYVVLILPTGVFVDRWDRKRLMVWSDAGRAVALGTVPISLLLERLTLAQLAIVALVEGTLYTFFNVAEAACMPKIVPREQLASALVQNQAIYSVSGLIGPALAGTLFGFARMLPFAVDAVSYAGSVFSLRCIRVPFQDEREASPLRLRAEISEGLGWLWRHHVVRFLALLTGVLMLFSAGYPLIMIVRAQQLGASPFIIGLLFASGGLGGTVGALLSRRLLARFSVGHVQIAAALIWSLGWPPYAFAPNLATLAVVNLIGWIIVPIFSTTQFSYRLHVIPDALQGRVNAVFKLLAFGIEPLGLAVVGGLLQVIGPVHTVLLIFVPQIALSIVALFYGPLRRVGRLADIASPTG